MSPANPPSPKTLPGDGRRPNPEGHHTCVRCPACATEECAVLQDLGTTCETMCAATEAQGTRAPKAKVRPRGSAAA